MVMKAPLNVDITFQYGWSKVLVSVKNDVVQAVGKVLQKVSGHCREIVLSPLANLVVLDSFTDSGLE